MPKPWAKYEIGFIRHAKFLALTGNAIALWWEGKNYCDEHLTDGIFPREALRTFRFHAPKSMELLMRSCGVKANGTPYAPLWEPVDIGGVSYLRMHDFLDHNDCREKTQARMAVAESKRAESRKRQIEFRERRLTERNADRNADRNALRNAQSNAVCNAPVTRMSQGEQNQNQNQIQKEQEQKKSGGGLTARSKRPIYQSDRFAVFEWQYDEISKTLGPHLDAFDLHGFFDDLTQRSRDHGLVIPSDRDQRWKWLLGQVDAEARQRGLPMADVPNPQNKRIAGLAAGTQAFLNRRQS